MPTPEAICEQCGVTFEPLHKSRPQKYCSNACKFKAATKRVMKDCEYCGKSFEVHKCREKKARYCSVECYGLATRVDERKLSGEMAFCKNCGKEFFVETWKLRKGQGKLCSRSCVGIYLKQKYQNEVHPNWQGASSYKYCENCGELFFAQHGNRKYCTHECYSETLSRLQPHETPRWCGGLTTKNRRARHIKKYTDWRESVFERDDFTCQICGVRGGNLHAHHLYRFSDFPHLRYDVGNGQTLCESCHKSIRGKENKHLRKIGLNPKKPPLFLSVEG